MRNPPDTSRATNIAHCPPATRRSCFIMFAAEPDGRYPLHHLADTDKRDKRPNMRLRRAPRSPNRALPADPGRAIEIRYPANKPITTARLGLLADPPFGRASPTPREKVGGLQASTANPCLERCNGSPRNSKCNLLMSRQRVTFFARVSGFPDDWRRPMWRRQRSAARSFRHDGRARCRWRRVDPFSPRALVRRMHAAPNRHP